LESTKSINDELNQFSSLTSFILKALFRITDDIERGDREVVEQLTGTTGDRISSDCSRQEMKLLSSKLALEIEIISLATSLLEFDSESEVSLLSLLIIR
jgi:hypothetical protein